jgi:hypothetical protein
MEMHMAIDLLQFGKWNCMLFSKNGSQSVQGYGIQGVEGGLPGIGMTSHLEMRPFSGWNSRDQLEVYLVEMQISWYNYIDTQSLCYFLIVRLQKYILIKRMKGVSHGKW